MKAVIMAGGKGTRLRPLTFNKPKPMVPMFNKPVMQYAVELLKKHDFTDIAVTVQYMPDVIKEYFGDGSEFDVNMRYFEEVTPLGTAGSVKNAEEFLDETFIVISGDGITDYDLTRAVEFHRKKGGIASIVMTRVQDPREYGVIMCNDNDRIIRFLEKPSWGEVFSDTVNTGIYVLEPEIFKYYKKDVIFDFSKDLFPLLMSEEQPMYGYVSSGYWSDVGSLDQYRQTHADILNGDLKVEIKAKQIEEGVWIGDGTVLEHGVKIKERPVYIGDNCLVRAGVEIGAHTVLGNNNTINSGTLLEHTLMWDNNYVGCAVELRGVTICNQVRIKEASVLHEGVVIGDNTQIGKRVTVKSQVKIWPNKVVGDNSVLSESLIWGDNCRKTMFSSDGVTGVANTEISPEMVVKLAVAHGSTVIQGGHVVLSTDYHRCSQVFKEAYAAGLLAAGVNVLDIGITTTPISRYAVKSLQAKGGVHVRMLPHRENNRILFEFLDEHGINISKDAERKIENAYIQEDFRRVNLLNLGAIKYVPQLSEAYRDMLLKTVNLDMIKRTRFRLLAAYDYLNLNWFIPALFEELGCQVTSINSEDYSLEDMAQLVQENQMDMGILLNSNADEVILFTSTGEIVRDENLMTLWAYITLDKLGDQGIGIPVTAPAVIETMVSQTGGKVFRTKANPRSIMEVSKESLFQPLFDGVYLFLQVLEYLQSRKKDMTSVMEELPRAFMYKQEVECHFSEKGLIMRRLIEEVENEKVHLLDGVKIFSDDGWILILPDCEESVFKLISEASSMEEAERLAAEYVNKIEQFKSAI